MAKHKLYQVRRFLKYQTQCAVCDKSLVRGDEGHYVSKRQDGCKSQVRCLDCGMWSDIRVRKPRVAASRGDMPAPAIVAPVVEDVPNTLGAMYVATLVSGLADAARAAMPVRHEALDQVRFLVDAGIANIYMVGPAGTGKSTLAADLASDLGRDFGMLSLSGGTDESHIFGRIVPTASGPWQYQESDFIRIYENGGIFLLDEVDGADANVMVAVNAALANGTLSNPMSGRMHKRHADTVIICAANTFGTGATAQYVGRNALDAATLDRFVGATVEVGYSARIEEKLAGGSWVLPWVRTIRDRANTAGLLRVVSTRMVVNGAKLAKAGMGRDAVKAALLTGWTEDEKAAVADPAPKGPSWM